MLCKWWNILLFRKDCFGHFNSFFIILELLMEHLSNLCGLILNVSNSYFPKNKHTFFAVAFCIDERCF